MDTKELKAQMDELNRKTDLILDIVNQQRIKAEAIEDMAADLSIIGKDVYDSAVEELDNQNVEIDPDEVKRLGVRVLKNIKNINGVIALFESATDFAKDAEPIMNDLIIDFTKRLYVFEQKGYFEFLGEAGKIADNVIEHFSIEDVKLLADNIVPMLQIVKSITQPEMLRLMSSVVKACESIEGKDIPEYSVLRLMRELGKPEMKKALGFMVTFIKSLAGTSA